MDRLRTTITSALPGRAEELQRLDAEVRTPLPLSTRVGVVGVDPGCGCSTAAGLAASVLAARRPFRVLGVNASGGSRSLLWHAGLARAAHGDPHDATRVTASTSQEATTGLVTTGSGLFCLDLATGQDRRPTDDARWWESVAPSGRFFDFVVTDWGARDIATIDAVVAASTVVCVACTAARSSAQKGVNLAAAAEAAGVRAVLVLVDTAGERHPAMAELVRLLPVPGVELPHDPAHTADAPTPSSALRPGTQLGALRLAAMLVRTAAPTTPETS